MPFFQIYPPPASLTGIIREFQAYHSLWGKADGQGKPFITCLANTEQNLYFYLNDSAKVVPAVHREIPLPPVVMTGPKYKPVGILFGQDHRMIKVVFHPTGTYRLLGIHMQQLVNNGRDATEIWGEEIVDVLTKLRRAASYDAMIEMVASFIEKKFDDACRPEEPLDLVAIEMLNPANTLSLKEWAAKSCLSMRQFERNFITRVGISPKLYIRIVRFEFAIRIKNDFPDKSWAEIALEGGFTDSSHLLKEFREFAEFPPSKFYLQPTSGHSDFPTG